MESNPGMTPKSGTQQQGMGAGRGSAGGAGSMSGTGGTGGTGGTTENLADRARSAVDTAEQKAGEVVDEARAKTGNFQATLADKLESGAQALRDRSRQMTQSGQGMQGAGAGAGAGAGIGGTEAQGAQGGMSAAASSRIGGFTQRAKATVADAEQAIAGKMESSAMWLRENDLTDVGAMLEHQVKQHPGRTALIALGVGFLIGRASSSSSRR